MFTSNELIVNYVWCLSIMVLPLIIGWITLWKLYLCKFEIIRDLVNNILRKNIKKIKKLPNTNKLDDINELLKTDIINVKEETLQLCETEQISQNHGQEVQENISKIKT